MLKMLLQMDKQLTALITDMDVKVQCAKYVHIFSFFLLAVSH